MTESADGKAPVLNLNPQEAGRLTRCAVQAALWRHRGHGETVVVADRDCNVRFTGEQFSVSKSAP